MDRGQSTTTLIDHLRVIRQQLPLIILVGLICGAIAYGISAVTKKSYTATASESVTDPNTALAALGSAGSSVDTPLQLASTHAPTVTRASVVAGVDSQLGGRISQAALKAAVTVAINPSSYTVDIQATAPSADRAAMIANAFAQVDTRLSTAQAQAVYANEANALASRIKDVSASADPATYAIYAEKYSTLKSLAATYQPVTVNALASPPSSPSSPKPVRDTVAGVLFGLLAGLALAYLRAALDRRVRGADDLEGLSLPIIGRIRRQALGHAGADEASHSEFSPIDGEAFRILRQNVQFLSPDSPADVLLVTSSVAEEGKSTVAASLALAFAEAGRRALLIECDLRRPVLAERLKLSPSPGLSDYLAGQAPLSEVLQSAASATTIEKASSSGPAAPVEPLTCLTAGTRAPSPANLLGSQRFRDLLTDVSEEYEVVVLDSAPLLSIADTLEIAPLASGVLLCVRVDKTTRDQIRGAQAALARIASRPTALVLTGVRQGADEYYGRYSESSDGVNAPA